MTAPDQIKIMCAEKVHRKPLHIATGRRRTNEQIEEMRQLGWVGPVRWTLTTGEIVGSNRLRSEGYYEPQYGARAADVLNGRVIDIPTDGADAEKTFVKEGEVTYRIVCRCEYGVNVTGANLDRILEILWNAGRDEITTRGISGRMGHKQS
ncbi:hypothetical protein [Agromyces sp. NPDC057865]|uniref:hypothetical protein n=1 Tax=Agromyces sp. NPDC057865 TaxID=3346267 RepID=UPI00366FAA95